MIRSIYNNVIALTAIIVVAVIIIIIPALGGVNV